MPTTEQIIANLNRRYESRFAAWLRVRREIKAQRVADLMEVTPAEIHELFGWK